MGGECDETDDEVEPVREGEEDWEAWDDWYADRGLGGASELDARLGEALESGDLEYCPEDDEGSEDEEDECY